VNGELRSLVYGRPAAVHLDPIEKKPFYHFLPGTSALSFGTSGCPLRCRFCQNWELSQSTPGDLEAPFIPAVEMAGDAASRRIPVIAFTYNEPTVFIEYLLDVAAAAEARGVRSVMVSCGFANETPLADICRALSAVKIDLKGFSEEFYRTVCGAELRPVLRSIKQVAKSGRHLEIVNLVVPTLNDSEKSLQGLAAWVAGELGPDVPVHFTRFHPDYQLLNLPPTPVSTLERARDIAMAKGSRYVYVGNVPGHPGNNTYCPACRKVVISRENFFVTETHLKDGACEYCKQKIAGVWT
jgi:pyruvate formate lyase activating enzyme